MAQYDEVAIRDVIVGHLRCTSPQGTIYHFTSADGAAAILSSKSLLASQVGGSNDANEVTYVCELYLQAVDTFRRTVRPSTPWQLEFFKELRRGLRRPPPEPFLPAVFTVSFCRGKRNLLHWLHYGRCGNGYALGFNTDGLSPIPEVPSLFAVLNVQYDRVRQQAAMSYGIAAAYNHLNALAERPEYADDARLTFGREQAHRVVKALDYVSPLMKDPAFKNEREARLIVPITGSAELSKQGSGMGWAEDAPAWNCGNRIIPRIKIHYRRPNCPFPLRSVTFGYNVDERSARASLSTVLRLKGYPPEVQKRVFRSQVPVRT